MGRLCARLQFNDMVVILMSRESASILFRRNISIVRILRSHIRRWSRSFVFIGMGLAHMDGTIIGEGGKCHIDSASLLQCVFHFLFSYDLDLLSHSAFLVGPSHGWPINHRVHIAQPRVTQNYIEYI